MKASLKYKIAVGMLSTLFCVGFVIAIVNGYYEYNYSHFIEIQREDLIARLGFLSWTTGMIYYPASLPILAGMLTILKLTGGLLIKSQWLFMLTPAMVIGLLFYTHSIDFLFWQDMRFWRFGTILMTTSIIAYIWLLRNNKKNKTEHNNVYSAYL